MKEIAAVLFDLDGVLVDACDWHYKALNKSLVDLGHSPINETDHINTFNGLPTKVKLHMLNVPSNEIDEINSLKQKHTIDIINSHATIMNEKIELHKFLHSMGIKIACVTNSIRQTAELMLEKTGQLNYIDLLISNEDVEKNKPNPEGYNKAVSHWNLKKSECLCVEDSDKGIQAVVNAMIHNLWVVKDTHDVTLEGYVNYMENNK